MATPSKDYAAELQAMGVIMEALSPLERQSQESVLRWVLEKLGFGSGELVKDQSGSEERREDNNGATVRDSGGQAKAGTINTVANKIGADSCRTVLIAAAIHLTLFQGRDSFSRSELVSHARSAKVWKSEYTNQTSTMIGRLADAGVLVEKAKDIYSMPDSAVAEYEPALA